MRAKPADIVIQPSQRQNYSTDGLTPRSSRVKIRSEDAYQDHDEIDLLPSQQQSQPLLASSTSSRLASSPSGASSNTRTSRGPAPTVFNHFKKVPLALGILAAGILIFLAALSYSKPELLVATVTEPVSSLKPAVSSPSEENKVEVKPTPDPQHHPATPGGHFIDYSNYSTFPLEPVHYAEECWKIVKATPGHGPYWANVDIDVPHQQLTPGHCASTLTYQFDGYVGLMAHLAILAQVAAFARERNRTLFIDDRYWNRGKWTDHFLDVRNTQPGPDPGCLPPPPEELVACPRSARHWVFNSRTAKFHLGPGFMDQYEDPYKHDEERLDAIYERAYQSFEKTIIPSEENAQLIATARHELGNAPYIGVHIRRGDRHPIAWRFHFEPIPIQNYADALQRTWQRLNEMEASAEQEVPTVWIASDSKQSIQELKTLLPPNTRSYYLGRSKHNELRALEPLSEYRQSTWNDLSLDQRRRETRGMVVDFALLTGAWPPPSKEDDAWPDSVVCTISSNVCKLSALFFGFERAFKDGLWVEIDNAGSIAPIWQAFEMF